jgi:hypothetical protein
MGKPTRPELPPQKPRDPPKYAGTVERQCGNCEHFDGGGLGKDGRPINKHGDCHNTISGRLQTRSIDGCAYGFYPCTTRWPLRAGPGGER